jgi:hypothetical protein
MINLLFLKFDKLVKSLRFRHAPASTGAGSAKAGIQNYLKTLVSRLRGNDVKGRIQTFLETIKFEMLNLGVTLSPWSFRFTPL